METSSRKRCSRGRSSHCPSSLPRGVHDLYAADLAPSPSKGGADTVRPKPPTQLPLGAQTIQRGPRPPVKHRHPDQAGHSGASRRPSGSWKRGADVCAAARGLGDTAPRPARAGSRGLRRPAGRGGQAASDYELLAPHHTPPVRGGGSRLNGRRPAFREACFPFTLLRNRGLQTRDGAAQNLWNRDRPPSPRSRRLRSWPWLRGARLRVGARGHRVPRSRGIWKGPAREGCAAGERR